MDDMRQYLAWAEKRISRLVIAEGLHCGLLGVTQGPLVLTFRIRLLHPSPTALRKLLALGPALSQALQVEGVRISDQPGHVAVEMPSPQPRTPSAQMLARASRGLSIAVGLDSERKPVRVDLQEHGALFWIGPSRRGKTQSLKSTLYALARCSGPERLRFAILCHERKRGDWRAFEDATACLGIATNPAEHEQVLRWAAGEFMSTKTDTSVLVIVVDDLVNLLQQADLAGSLAEISSMGAGVGVHLLAGTQEGGSKRGTGGSAVENNATAKILYRNSNAAGAARASGQGAEGVQSLSGAKGDALLLEDGHGQRIATGLADDRDILQLRQGSEVARPWNRSEPLAGRPLASAVAGADVGVDAGSGSGGSTSGSAAVPGGSASGSEPVLDGEPRTAEERATVRDIYARIGTKNGACRAIWGRKNGETYRWLNDCLDEGRKPKGNHRIDMNTDEGLATVEALRDAGLLPDDDITETIRYH